MIIDLHELLQEDNGNRSYHLQLEADVFETSTASYKIKDYDLQLSFHNEGKKHISSRCEGFVVLEIPCDRCLEPVDYKIDIDYFKWQAVLLNCIQKYRLIRNQMCSDSLMSI